MKYFFDTEFLEGPQKTFFGKTKPTIDLISIGIVAEDGREYYAVSKDFNLKQAWKDNWIQENVLLPIYKEWVHGDMRNHFQFSYSTMKWLLKSIGKSNNQISFEIIMFTLDHRHEGLNGWLGFTGDYVEALKKNSIEKPQFYAYYADYDWVVFCWLFGRMIDLPKGFPMYCRDLKQMLDDKLLNWNETIEYFKEKDGLFLKGYKNTRQDLSKLTLKQKLDLVKKYHSKYPEQTNEHNALADARWNFELYKFLEELY